MKLGAFWLSVLKIKPEELKLGYAVKLPGSWMKHPFLSGDMIIETSQQLQIIRSLNLEFVFFYQNVDIRNSKNNFG